MKCIESGCNEEGNHKLRTVDGNIIHVCDEHLKRWTHCEEVLSLRKNIERWSWRRRVLTVAFVVAFAILICKGLTLLLQTLRGG